MPKSYVIPAALAAALCLSLAGCDRGRVGQGGDADAADTSAIEQVERQMIESLRAKDSARFISFYAPDAAVIFPGDRPVVGSAAIAQSFEAMIADPAFALEFETGKTAMSGDLAYTRGTYRATYTDPGSRQPTTDSGNYVTVFRKQDDGSWKVVEDITSPGAPPPEVAEST